MQIYFDIRDLDYVKIVGEDDYHYHLAFVQKLNPGLGETTWVKDTFKERFRPVDDPTEIFKWKHYHILLTPLEIIKIKNEI